jgi:hypothetical protein
VERITALVYAPDGKQTSSVTGAPGDTLFKGTKLGVAQAVEVGRCVCGGVRRPSATALPQWRLVMQALECRSDPS